jgi:hypothetical protein
MKTPVPTASIMTAATKPLLRVAVGASTLSETVTL